MIIQFSIRYATKRVGKFTQSADDDLVVGLKNTHGGNVTVMKKGQPVFRVHQPRVNCCLF